MSEKLMTIKDVAEFMQCSEISVRRMIARRELRHTRIGKGRGSIRIKKEQLQEYIKQKSEDGNERDNGWRNT